MVDVVDKATRSRMMSGIKSKNTRPEMYLRKRLHALGFRFRLHVQGIPGKPDLVLPKYRALIVVHGCFWHGHNCKYFKLPITRRKFWLEKISANQLRDARALQAQQDLGWRVLVLWECAVRASIKKIPSLDCVGIAKQWLTSSSASASLDEHGIRGL